MANAISKHFVVDAALGNTDIAAHLNNVILDGKTLWRIDNGCNIRFRARGGLTDVSRTKLVTEIDSLRDPKISNLGPTFYGHLTPDEIKQQAKELLAQSDRIQKAVFDINAVLSIEKDSELINTLHCRLTHLQDRFCPNPNAASLAPAMTKYTSAGTFLYTTKDNEPYVLLGQRIKHRWWGNFGGKSDPVDNFLFETAARETEEESLGLYDISPTDLLERSAHDIVTINKKGHLEKFRMYFAPCKHHPESKFKKKLKESTGCHAEYTDFIWLKVKDLLSAIEDNEHVIEENQSTIAVNADGVKDPLILHPPLYHMLTQEPVVQHLRDICDATPQEGRTLTLGTHGTDHSVDATQSPLALGYPEADRRHVAKTLTHHGSVVRSLKEEQSKKRPTSPHDADSLTQTEFHLKTSLGDDYKPQSQIDNIKTFMSTVARKTLKDTVVNALDEAMSMERRHADKLAFYHATSREVAFLYDIYRQFRMQLAMRSGGSYQVLRGLDDHFAQFTDVHAFIAYYTRDGSVDNYTENYAEMGLSTNPFLFGNHATDTSSCVYHFSHNDSRTPPQINAILDYFLSHLGLVDQNKKFLELFDQFKKKYGWSPLPSIN